MVSFATQTVAPASFIVFTSPVDTSKDIDGGIDSASPDSAVIYAIISIKIIIYVGFELPFDTSSMLKLIKLTINNKPEHADASLCSWPIPYI